MPIYNAGSYIERCAPSLVNQSLGADAYEVVYVDDGSTDDSAERLGRLAEAHAHVRVYRQENSGWPGKPRNVGIDRSRGKYVQFVDQDDELSYEALERLYALAERNGSDIVLGKVHGTMQGPSNVFKRTVERCTAADAPLFESLTPHKMFRRDFLREHGIRFPEGRVRLEDQLFMARTYVRAKTVSILGNYPCYRWNRREDGGNNSSRRITADDYYGHLGNVVEAIKEGTQPGDLQDRLLRRSYRVELLRPVSEPRVLRRTGKDLEEYFTTVRRMAMTSFPPGVSEGLPAISRLRAELLVQGRLGSLVELARRTEQIKAHVDVDDMRWRNDKLVIRTRVGMVRADGEPLTVVEHGGRMLLDPELLDGIRGRRAGRSPTPSRTPTGNSSFTTPPATTGGTPTGSWHRLLNRSAEAATGSWSPVRRSSTRRPSPATGPCPPAPTRSGPAPSCWVSAAAPGWPPPGVAPASPSAPSPSARRRALSPPPGQAPAASSGSPSTAQAGSAPPAASCCEPPPTTASATASARCCGASRTAYADTSVPPHGRSSAGCCGSGDERTGPVAPLSPVRREVAGQLGVITDPTSNFTMLTAHWAGPEGPRRVRLQQSNTDQQMLLRSRWSSSTSSRIASGS